MGIIKLLLISVVVLFLVITGISSLLPSEIRVSRALDISAHPDTVMKALKELSKWNKWNEFVKPVSDISISGDSLLSPQLDVVIIPRAGRELGSTWMQPGHPVLASVFSVYQTRGVTTIHWYFTCHFKWYPWEKLGSIVYDKQLGTPMEQSLQNLKKRLEPHAE
ncbi:MAG: hypothetical protein ABI151_01795 [Chitinophagaceae bacterium]